MSEAQKIMMAVAAVFVMGFVMVGLSKEDQLLNKLKPRQKLETMLQCKRWQVKNARRKSRKQPGSKCFSPSAVEGDKETYVTLKWVGENADKGGFKNASCTLHASLGGISELIIDDKVIIKKKM